MRGEKSQGGPLEGYVVSMEFRTGEKKGGIDIHTQVHRTDVPEEQATTIVF